MSVRPSTQVSRGKMPMVVWDGLGLCAQRSGVGVNGAMLYQSLKELGCEPYVISLEEENISYLRPSHNVHIERSAHAWINRWRRLKPIYPLLTYRKRKELWPDLPVIFHGLSNVNLPCAVSRKPGDKLVVSIHDLIPMHTRSHSPLAIQMRLLLPIIVRRADKIITGSYWTKIQLLEHYGLELADKTENISYGTIYPPVTHSTWQNKSIDALTIARGEDYKRLDFIVEMAKRLPLNQFVLVTDENGKRMLGQRPSNVTVLSRLTQSEIEDLYAKSKIMVHPSLYEGWCLPAADALVRGLYLLFCKGSGIDEVTSYAKDQSVGLSRDAKIDDWVSAFDVLLQKGDPGVGQVMLPRWSEIGQKTLNIYQSLL